MSKITLSDLSTLIAFHKIVFPGFSKMPFGKPSMMDDDCGKTMPLLMASN